MAPTIAPSADPVEPTESITIEHGSAGQGAPDSVAEMTAAATPGQSATPVEAFSASIPSGAPATSSEPAIEAPITPTGGEAAELVEVWRPGRTGAQRRQRRPQSSQAERRKPRPAQPQAEGPAQPQAEGVDRGAAVESSALTGQIPSPGEERSSRRHRRPRELHGGERDREKQHRDRPQRADRPQPGRSAHERVETVGPGSRPSRRDRPDRAARPDRPDRDPELRAKYIKGRGDQDRRDKLPDPNSPFAKLAALKAQLEADAKERR